LLRQLYAFAPGARPAIYICRKTFCACDDGFIIKALGLQDFLYAPGLAVGSWPRRMPPHLRALNFGPMFSPAGILKQKRQMIANDRSRLIEIIEEVTT